MNLLNTKSKLSSLLFLGIVCCACILGSCKDDDVIDPDAPSVPKPGTAVENININVKALRKLIEAVIRLSCRMVQASVCMLR